MGAVREGGAIHTEGEWFAGGGSWVSTDHPIDGGISGSDDVTFYGGNLIGESISSCNIPIITAAPDMFKALLAVKQKLHFVGMPGEKVCKVTGKSDWSDEIALIEAALTKAVTRVPVPITPVATSINVGEGWRVIDGGETLIPGDQYDNNSTWFDQPDWRDIENSVGTVKRDSAINNCICRRRIDPVEPVAAHESDPDSVGAAYRLIGADEVFIKGDEVDIYTGLPIPLWITIDSNIGKVKRDSSVCNNRCRRKVEAVTQSSVNDVNPVDAEFEVLEQPKPPLGLMPRQIWLENRRDDIYDAIERYRAAGKDVSRDWLNELLDLDNEMRPF